MIVRQLQRQLLTKCAIIQTPGQQLAKESLCSSATCHCLFMGLLDQRHLHIQIVRLIAVLYREFC